MKLLKLDLENFCCYENSSIDFANISSAVIIGEFSLNKRKSNAVGKSTIFEAIKFVLFNECNVKFEKLIRNNSDKLKVSLEFQIFEDIYKIVRSRTKKSSDVKLFKKEEESYKDISTRRAQDTEIEIAKLLKVNYKTFSNSVLFSQNDLTSLTFLTPEKRKEILKDSFKLLDYSKYEKLAKKELKDLEDKINFNNGKLNLLDLSNVNIIDLKYTITIYTSNINNIYITGKQSLLDCFSLNSEKLLDISNNIFKLNSDISIKEKERLNKINNISNLNNKINNLNNELNNLKTKGQGISKEIENLSKSNIEELLKDKEDISLRLENCILNINNLKSSNSVLESKIKELKEFNINGNFCKSCRQVISDEHKEKCSRQTVVEIASLASQANSNNIELARLSDDKGRLSSQLQRLNLEIDKDKENKIRLPAKTKELEELRNRFKVSKAELLSSEENKVYLENELATIDNNDILGEIEKLNIKKRELVSIENKLKSQIDEIDNKIKVCQNDISLIEFKLRKYDEDKKLFDEITLLNSELKNKSILYGKVIEAFGSGGIPNLIIQSLLDELQDLTNEFLLKFNHNIQVNFVTTKESNKVEVDTLDINYIVDGIDMEFSQLSGAQKLIATLSLRLGLCKLIQNKYNASINFILLDEVDASLDDESLDTFLSVVKELQNDFMVLLISHNNYLKSKFKNVILVSRDSEGISNISLENN